MKCSSTHSNSKKRLFGFTTNNNFLFVPYSEFKYKNSRNEGDQVLETNSLTIPTATVAPESLTANLPS